MDSVGLYSTYKKGLLPANVLLTRGDLLLKLYTETQKQQFADSLLNLFCLYSNQKINKDSKTPYVRSIIFKQTSILNYYQKKYKLCLLNSDSASFVMGAVLSNAPEDLISDAFRGLSLLHLGHEAEGIRILETALPKQDDFYAGTIFNEIYNYYKSTGNLAKALKYHEKMMLFNGNYQMLRHQGELLEIEQQYNAAARELQISSLKEKQSRYLSIGLLIAIILGSFTVILLVRFRNNKRKTTELIDKIEEMTLLQIVRIEEATEEAEEAERKKIGQELHDNLASSLAGVLSFMRTKINKEQDPIEKQSFMNACGILEASYNETRGKSHEIYYRNTDNHFLRMLSDNISLFFSGTSISVNSEFDTIGLDKLSAEIKTTLLYTLKELITNVLKHSRAKKVEISLYLEDSKVCLVVSDDGIGMNSKKIGKKSLGITSVKNRLINLDGSLSITGTSPSGTTVAVSISMNDRL